MSSAKTVLVTGANTGLGYQIVRALYASEITYNILVGGRSFGKAEEAIRQLKNEFATSHSNAQAIQIDIEDDTSIASAFKQVEESHGRLDVLINNAGVQLDTQLSTGGMTMREIWDQTYKVNVTSTQIMTSTFVPLLLKSEDPRLLFIASGTSSLATSDNLDLFVNRSPPKGWPKDPKALSVFAYRASKTGLNMMMREWYRLLKEDGVKVWAISPGYLATGLGAGQEVNKRQGAIDPAIGGSFVKDVVEGTRDSDVGKVILREGVQPW